MGALLVGEPTRREAIALYLPVIMARWSPVRFILVLVSFTTSACAWIPPAEPATPPEALAKKAPPPVEPSACEPAPIVTNGSRNRMRVALTFDACSTRHNEYDERVIRTLLETSTPATLFIGGGWALANPERVLELAQYPDFEFGNHTFSHPHMPQVKDDRKVLEELQRTQQILYDMTGRIPRYFRPPFGEVNERVAFSADTVRAALRAHDVALVTADTAGKWPFMEDQTSTFAYARLHGAEELYVSGYSDEALDRWADRVRRWSAGGRDVFVYFDNDVKVHAPYNAICLADKLGVSWPVDDCPAAAENRR